MKPVLLLVVAVLLGVSGCTLEGGLRGADEASLEDTSASQPDAAQLPDGAIAWTDARAHVGSSVALCGVVVSSKFAADSNGQPTFLNIGAPYPDTSRVTVIIFGDALGNFPSDPATTYQGRNVCVTGTITPYEDIVEIKVTTADQIIVVS